jgi:kynurenine formamidase
VNVSAGDPPQSLPAYDELPVLEPLGLRHAWGVFGPEDQLGTINLLTPERVLDAARLVRTGRTVTLTRPLDAFDPPFYGRERMRHTVFRLDRNYWDDRVDNLQLQASTHWDGLRHVQARELGFWGGLTDEASLTPGGGPLGVERWAQRGIVGRGVLLDLVPLLDAGPGGYDPFVSRSIDPDLLDEAARRQQVELRVGDIVCLRFGWMQRYLGLDGAGRAAAAEGHDFAGLAAGESMARWLWDRHVAAIAGDNPAVEVSPGDRRVGSLHRRLLPLLGFAIGELFDLDALAAECAADGRWDFLFVSVPLNLAGGVGSPANAIAVR